MKTKIKSVKKFFFPGLGIVLSVWFSIMFAFWAIFGFFATEVFAKKYLHTGKIKSLKFNLKEWELHLHHWIWPGLLLAGAYMSGITNPVPISVLGFTSGIIFQDLYRDKKWHKVIYKRERA
jgi:hypothetical protein